MGQIAYELHVLLSLAVTPPTIGNNRVWVPQHLFKLVYDPSTNRAWAHWQDNNEDAKAGKPISYEELVKRTGVEFLPGLDVRQ